MESFATHDGRHNIVFLTFKPSLYSFGKPGLQNIKPPREQICFEIHMEKTLKKECRKKKPKQIEEALAAIFHLSC